MRRYPYFFLYLGSVLCSTGVLLFLQPPTSYRYWLGYWISEAVCAVTGFGVTWEIYAQLLAPYRGVRRMAQATLGVLFLALFTNALVGLRSNPGKTLAPITILLERNLRVVQALLLLVLVGLTVHYALPMGRNVRSMLVGYSFYIGCLVVALSLRAEWGKGFDKIWQFVQQLAWIPTITIWCFGMWTYSESPVPDSSLEYDYDRISQHTVKALGRLRSHTTQSWRT